MPELEEGNLWIRGTFPGEHLAGRDVSRRPTGARAIMQHVSRSRRRSSPRSAGPTTAPIRRLLQRRVLRAAASRKRTGRPVKHRDGLASWSSAPSGPATKEELIEEMNAELSRRAARRRLELLAVHPRQRHGGALGRQGRQLGQDLRPRPRRAGGAGRQDQDRPATASRASRTWASSASRASRTWSSASIRQKCKQWGVSVADVQNVVRRPSAARPCSPDDRRREDASTSRSAGPSACATATRRSSTSRSTSPTTRSTSGYVPSTAQTPPTGPAPASRQSGTSVVMPVHDRQPVRRHVQRHRPASPRRRLGDLVTPLDEEGQPDPNGDFVRPALDDLPRAGQPADRREVQRPRPRPGRRRRRGPGKKTARLFLPAALPRRLERRVRGDGRSRSAADVHHSAVAGD